MKTIQDSEWQAKCFAGELLVPVCDPRLNNLKPYEIAKLCGVSEDAARLMQRRIVKNKPF